LLRQITNAEANTFTSRQRAIRVDQGDLVVPIERESTRPTSTKTEAMDLKKTPIENRGRKAPTIKGHYSKRKVHPRKLLGVKAIV